MGMITMDMMITIITKSKNRKILNTDCGSIPNEATSLTGAPQERRWAMFFLIL